MYRKAQRLRQVVNRCFSSRFLLYTNTATSCTLLGTADILHQIISRENNEPIDFKRTARITAMGLVLGPMTHGWYKILDGVAFRGSRVVVVVKKIVTDFSVAPIFSCTAISGCAMLEGKSVSGALREYKQKFWHIMLLDLSVWPPAQFFNFFFLPPSMRVLYVNCVVLAYNCGLTYIKHNHALGLFVDDKSHDLI